MTAPIPEPSREDPRGPELSPELCQVLLESLGDRLVLVDRHLRVRWCNATFARLAGLAAAELGGRSLAELFKGDQVGALRAMILQALAGQPQRLPYLCLDFIHSHATGWFSVLVRPVQTPEGPVQGVLLQLREMPVAEDTTVLLREDGPAYQPPIASELACCGGVVPADLTAQQDLRMLLNAARESILLLDRQGRVLIANRTAAERLGKAVEDMVGQNIADFLPPEVARLRFQWGERAFQTGTSVFFEDQRGGRWLEHRFTPILDQTGQPCCLACFSRDITERKKAEADRDQLLAELLEFQSRLRAVLEGAGESILLLDNEGRVVLANPVAAMRLGDAPGDLIGRRMWDFLPAEVRPATEALFRQLLASGQATTVEGEFGGLYYEASFYPVRGPGGQVLYVALFGRDVTPRKKMELQIEHQRRQLQTLLDHAPIFLWAMDAEGIIITAEGSVLQSLGLAPRQVVGVSIFTVVQDLPEFTAACRRALRGERVSLRHEWQGRVFDTRILPLPPEAGGLPSSLGIMLDVTGRVQAERALMERLEFESTLLAISSRFVGPCHLDQAIQQSLADLGRFCQAGRAYLFRFSEDGRFISNTHEWCAEGVRPEIQNLQNIPVEEVRWSMDMLARHGVLHIPDVSRMPPEARREQELLQAQNIASLLLVAVPVQGRFSGFVGFDDVTGTMRWGPQHEGVLRLFSEVLANVLERHLAEEALRTSENFNRAIVQSAASGLAVFDRELRCRLWNPYLERMTGLEEAQARGQYLHALVWLAGNETPEELLRRALRGEVHEGADAAYLVPATGRRGWHQATYSPLRSGAGEIIGVLCSVLDITQRKLAEEELRRSEERFSRAFHLSPILMLVTRLRDGLIVNANDYFLRCLGLSREEVIGKSTMELGLYESPEMRERMTEPLRRGGTVRNLEVRLRLKQGLIDCLLSAAPVDLGGEPHVLSLALDITERKRAELAIRESREQLRTLAERLEIVREEERRQIAREIHDDLGQCLTSLKLDLAWVARNLQREPAALEARLADMMKVVDQTIQSVRRISSELRPGVLDDLGLPAAIEWQAQEFERRTGIPCQVHCDEGLDQLDSRMATALFRILQEALTNIIRHAQATRVRVNLARTNEQVILRVRDNGTGLPPKARQRSEGLGLLSMRERAAALGGRFTVVSRRGRGTTIVARLPLAAPAAAAPVSPPPPEAGAAPEP
ncbi:MAG: PAS domain S-box protein [Verrucomicrobiae bacterium]|nr:PAS domain S-box protein [Verrucomicrobiae bacterium]